MSYYEQASKLNFRFKEIFSNLAMDEQTKKDFIDLILWFGQVAKYRCRSNSAYDNFSSAVFNEMAKLNRQNLDEEGYAKLEVQEVL